MAGWSGSPADSEATAVWFSGPGMVELRRETVGMPGPGEVRIRAVASGLSHGTEMLVLRGQVPVDLPLDLPTLQGTFAFPIKYGYASVGRVEVVGPEVQQASTGDLVFALHPHQTEYVAPASVVHRLPEGMDAEAGVLHANLSTALNVMLDAAPRLGERVVIFGQGVVGLLLARLTRLAGCSFVVAVEPVPLRQALARGMGAHAVLSPGPDTASTVRRLTGGMGADLALEASGSPYALPMALECVASGGTVVVCSWYGTKAVTLDLGERFHRDRLRIVSSQVGSIDPSLRDRWNRERRARTTDDLLQDLDPSLLITHRIPFSRAAEAYSLVDRRPDDVVQVILTYEENNV